MGTRIALIGAGSATFGLRTVGRILQSEALRDSEVVLHDIDARALEAVEGVARTHLESLGRTHALSATTSRREALEEAAFCIISIEVGDRFELWEQDWRMPQQYGFRQVFGENGGPGGLFHSLRIIPPILEICGDIATLCPGALVINLSNPMSRICLAVKRAYPEVRFVGLCHEVESLPLHLPLILDTPLSNLSFQAGGLNHFSVLLNVRYRDTGEDAYPDLRRRAPAYFEGLPPLTQVLREGFAGQLPEPAADGHWADRRLVKAILERFGYLPVTEDSHFGEYVHWAYDVVDHKGIVDFYDWYKAWSSERPTASRLEALLEDGHWGTIPIVEGVVTDSGHTEMAVNVPNKGLIDNLPEDLVVEVPGIVDKNGVHGVKLGPLPKGIAGLMRIQAAVQDLTVEAALKGSREIALQALLLDPVVDSLERAEALLGAMLDVQAPYLGYIR
ncbi:MAG: alpha-glucosidase [Anaerolineae bacterium]|jgi:alpha-galactosidase